MSLTLSAKTSEIRSLAPWAMSNAALYLGRRIEWPHHLLNAQHQLALAGLVDERETMGEIGPIKRNVEEEAQRILPS